MVCRSVSLVPLGPEHDVEAFFCGWRAFDSHLRRTAWAEQHSGKTRTYVACPEALGTDPASEVVGYLTLTAGVVEAALCRDAIYRRERRQLIPVVIIVRLAVSMRWQRRGIGRALLLEGARRSKQGALVLDAQAVVAPAIGQDARSFLIGSGFRELPGDRWHLYLPAW